MGNLMRQFWFPGMRSDELRAPDCPPVRIKVMDENLIAFRVTSGKVGLIEDTCPHRGASMFFGRNEEEGLRCVYHGWKFDITGQCTDMMSEPAESNFKDKVRTVAYPTQERNGIVWVYMGPREVPPLLPDLEANMIPQDRPVVRAGFNNCNWLQAMENNMDTSHAPILHSGAITVVAAMESGQREAAYRAADRAPKFVVRDTDFGCSYGAYRPAEEESNFWGTMHWLFPFYTMSPTTELGSTAMFVATVPVDDWHSIQWQMGIRVGPGRAATMELKADSTDWRDHPLPNSTDWFGRFRNALDPANDFGLNREIQQAKPATIEGWTGLKDVPTQDEAMRWSQGRADNNGVVDRTREHLGTTDSMIIRVRHRLIEAAKALRDHGTVPSQVDRPEVYRQRSGWVVLPQGADYWEATREKREAFARVQQPMSSQIPSS
jgi:phthalate 4,5-dioxygenase oxygenase subunit